MTATNLTLRKSNLSAAKRALLEKRFTAPPPDSRRPATIPRRPDRDSAPVSFAQQRLWFLEQLDPGRAAYNIPIAVRFAGDLSVTALSHAMNEIVRRHESLRTTFQPNNGDATQVIGSPLNLSGQIADLSGLQRPGQQELVLQLAKADAARPFDLQRGPLIRASIIRSSAEESTLILCMHHIVSDGWSMGILINEIAVLYQAFSAGAPSKLQELEIQYADFADWQRAWLQGAVVEKQLGYWREQLLPVPQPLDLPADHSRPAVQTYRGASYSFAISELLADRLAQLMRTEGATLFMALLAVFKVLLFRYTSQENIAVGSPVANRNRQEIEPLIGFFVNTIVLRTELSSAMTYRQLVAAVKEKALGAYAHQDLPFERLVAELQPERDLSRTPLFQVMFIVQNAPTRNIAVNAAGAGSGSKTGPTVMPLFVETSSTKFDLTMTIEQLGSSLKAALEYNTDIFKADTAERMAGHYLALLDRMTYEPDRRFSEIDLLTGDERRQVLVEWNRTEREYRQGQCIHELFEAQVAGSPDATAAVCGLEQLTYQELNARADAVARRLASAGVRPETTVGICVSRSLEMVIAMLGVLKSGGAYVPLDPAYPRDRIEFMVEDAGIKVLVAEESHAASLQSLGTEIIYSGFEIGESESAEPATVVSEAKSENAAYIIYTSGSTGKPKGVVIQHQSAVTFLHWAREAFLPDELNGVLASTSICFDLSIFELFAPLSWGGTLILVENILALPGLEAPDRVRLINTVPSAINELVRIGGVPKGVTTINLAGEALQGTVVREAYKRTGIERLYNLYGPSEDTTYSTYALTDSAGNRMPSIGKPVADTRTYIVDRRFQPLGAGLPGELLLGGKGLARCYYNRPELTAERFIPDEFSGQAGARLYRTGDLVRYRADGNIDYLGRIDHQVKIRGYRVELGEIEAALATHPAVRDLVVAACEDPVGKRLVAYVVLEDVAEQNIAELQAHVREKLPEHMVPSSFVFLGALPLTPNGKVDRRALPVPERAASESANYVAPRDAVELQLAQIWREVLGTPLPGIRDNFFALGGHSLAALRLAGRVEETFGKKLVLAALFNEPTIESLARILRGQNSQVAQSSLIEIQPKGTKAPLFFVHPATGNVFRYFDLARYLGPDQPLFGLQSMGLDGVQPPLTTINEMASHYVDSIRAVQPTGPYFLGGWSMGGIVAYEIASRLKEQGEKIAFIGLLDSGTPDECLADSMTILLQFGVVLGLPVDALIEAKDELGQLGSGVQLGKVLEHARKSELIPADISFEQLTTLFDVFKTNIDAAAEHSLDPTSARLTLFKAEEQFGAVTGGKTRRFFKRLSRLNRNGDDRHSAWADFAGGGLEVHNVPGNHFTLLNEPHIAAFAATLKACLEKAQSR